MSVRRLHHEQPEDFAFTAENLEWARKVIDRYPAGRQASAVIPLLWRAQEQHDGWLPEPAIRVVAEMLGMPKIRVLEVATFYTMFQLQPVGKKAHVQVCGTTPCQLRGAEDLVRVCKSKIAAHAHELSEDGDFSWEEVECLGACVNAPMIQIFKDTYEDLTPESLAGLLDDIAAGREVTPGPQVDRRFGAPEGGAVTLNEIEDSTKGADPAPHVVKGAEQASHAFAGPSINGGGNDYNGVPTPAEEAVARVINEHATKVANDAPTKAPEPAKKVTASKLEGDKGAQAKAATPKASNQNVGKPDSSDRAEVEVARSTKSAADEPQEGERPVVLDAPRDGGKDDLKRIKGVGPKIESQLNDLGVFHFDQIANWTEDNKSWIDGYLKFRGRIDREEWIPQAKLLAEGGETEFSQRVAKGDVPSSKT